MFAIRTRRAILFAGAFLSILVGITLLSINVYGLFADIRKENLHSVDPQFLRFDNKNNLSYLESLHKLRQIKNEDNLQYILKANKIVNQSLTHIRWPVVDRVEFRQLIPIWENFFLYFLGIFYNDPQIQRYHYVDYKRSIERGIGICGDASMILSQILDKKNIENRIISFRGHVITEATLDNNTQILLDPDFGVEFDISLEQLLDNPDRAKKYYREAGYSGREAQALVNSYSGKYASFDSVYHFMPKRYIFEYTSYVLKWLLPFTLLVLPLYLFTKEKRRLTQQKKLFGDQGGVPKIDHTDQGLEGSHESI